MANAEIHCWSHTELEVLVDAQLTQHTHHKAIVPAVLVGGDEARSLRAVLVLNGLRPNVLQFQILQMRTNEQSEVEGAQVGIRTVLYRPAKLRGSRQNHHEHGQDEKNSFLHFTL